MKVKSLLTVACLAGALSASAVVPLTFKGSGGSYDFPTNEDGTPAFDEEGAIALTSNANAVNGMWWRTWTLTEACGQEYCVFAFDYKDSNREVNDLVVFPQEGNANYAEVLNGKIFTISDQWQTVYMVLNRANTTPNAVGQSWGEWGNPEGEQYKKGKNYFWVSNNDSNAKTAGWSYKMKNPRMLTLAEASEECKAVEMSEFPIEWGQANLDFAKSYDDDMEAYMYGWAGNVEGYNSVLYTMMVKPIPAELTTLKVDYKLVGDTNAKMGVMLPNFYPTWVADYDMEPVSEDIDDAYEADWKTATFDLSEQFAANNFAQNFGSNHQLWIVFRKDKGFGDEHMVWLNNAKLVNPNAAGVAEIAAPENTDARVFNVMGIECKGELTPGLYIRGGKKFIVK